ncbi:feruloyl-CoA synthase [Tomitella biformata]|uniref:feruloyl-CoA synthase n=1 Tax=Tomitella biformata TaxID=630403 RepID=UPI000467B112|nr:feruloyl-CoA synthase [Tomitella biformata]
MTHPLFSSPSISVDQHDDGSIVIASRDPLRPYPTSVVHTFRALAAAHPERVLIGQRGSDGQWRTCTWSQARRRADRIAQGLLDRGLADQPIMILSGNSIDHLILTLAAYTVGAPVVPTSVAYALQSEDHHKLKAVAEVAHPAMIFAEDSAYRGAVEAIGVQSTVVSATGDLPGSLALTGLEATPGDGVEARFSSITPDTVAKIMFTSGSTGTPKGVLNTHGMLSANQQQMRQVWPFIAAEPPILLDWLPWSHTFGGNHNLNLVLTNGGSLWIDDGRPSASGITQTVANLADVQPTIYFNVPAGYAALIPILERDDAVAALFFKNLRLGFFAAAALPQSLWERLTALAAAHDSAMQMTTSWGMTETAPAATSTHFPITRSNSIGVPLPGVELKLQPHGEKIELRLKGPNVTPGFFGRPDLTASEFDSEGYLRTGDAVAFVDPANPALGLTFNGRIAEDFKLDTGTFVSVGTLRPNLLSAMGGLLTDAVICGQDNTYAAALIWLHPEYAGHCSAEGMPDDWLRERLTVGLDTLASTGTGSSGRVERLLILPEPPNLDAGEITDKAYVNQQACRDLRHTDVSRLLSVNPESAVILRRTTELPPRSH